jgi:hypothetical protein
VSYSWRASGAKVQPANQAPQLPVSQQQPASQSGYGQQAPSQPKAPDMSAYSQVPFGARANDLSAPNLPYNMWGAAGFNFANNSINNGQGNYTSYTLPGYGQSFDGATGQPKGEPFQSWDGNMAYAQPSQRPGPISWTSTGPDGQQREGIQGFQQAAMQRDATTQGIINRLGDYQTGGLTGMPSYDVSQMLRAGEESLRNNTWQNPFMDPMAYNTLPSFTQRSYDPTPQAWRSPPPNQFAAPMDLGGEVPFYLPQERPLAPKMNYMPQPAPSENFTPRRQMPAYDPTGLGSTAVQPPDYGTYREPVMELPSKPEAPPPRMGAAQAIEPATTGDPYPSDEPAKKPKRSMRAPWRSR